jgi:hypothetical protein
MARILSEQIRIQLLAKSLILRVYDILARHTVLRRIRNDARLSICTTHCAGVQPDHQKASFVFLAHSGWPLLCVSFTKCARILTMADFLRSPDKTAHFRMNFPHAVNRQRATCSSRRLRPNSIMG